MRSPCQVHRQMHYLPGSTGVATAASEAFAQRMGVCQDFAHVMLALCRAAGLPSPPSSLSAACYRVLLQTALPPCQIGGMVGKVLLDFKTPCGKALRLAAEYFATFSRLWK